LTVNGERYAVQVGADRVESRESVGANRRTGEFVGGGAVLGTIIGAIAGGGKGAAIGAAAGAAGGAGAEIATSGRIVRIPAESVLTFRLERPLEMGVPDSGSDRNGVHYHQ
jgi:outer membrane lipoprotein SlyB